MARNETWTKLFAPDGTPVEVSGEPRADVLKGRGYTTSKPRNPASTGVRNTPASELKAKDDEIAQLKADLEAATAPPPADDKK